MVVIQPDGSVLRPYAKQSRHKRPEGSVIHLGEEETTQDAKEAGRPLTAKYLKELVKMDRRMYYNLPELNDKLYLHFGGFTKIAALEPFTGLKCIYFDCNGIEKIEGLETCTKLRSLMLNQNAVRKIEGLDNNTELWSLSLAENFVRKIENLSHLKRLNTLNLDKNHVGHGGYEDLVHLVDCSISTLDLQNNKIDDVRVFEEVFFKMKNLAVLYLKGNPVIKKFPNYRKTMIARIPSLRYLDDRPIFPDESRYAAAYLRGGMEEERKERKFVAAEKKEAQKQNWDAFSRLIEDAKSRQRERTSMQMEDKYTAANDPVELARRQRAVQFAQENPETYRNDDGSYSFPASIAAEMGVDASGMRLNTAANPNPTLTADNVNALGANTAGNNNNGPNSERSTRAQTNTEMQSATSRANTELQSQTSRAQSEVQSQTSRAQSQTSRAQSERADESESEQDEPYTFADQLNPQYDANARSSANKEAPAKSRKVVYDDIWDTGNNKEESKSSTTITQKVKNMTNVHPGGMDDDMPELEPVAKPFMPWAEGAGDDIKDNPEAVKKRMEQMIELMAKGSGKGKEFIDGMKSELAEMDMGNLVESMAKAVASKGVGKGKGSSNDNNEAVEKEEASKTVRMNIVEDDSDDEQEEKKEEPPTKITIEEDEIDELD